MEKTYIIPLRQEVRKAPPLRKAKKAITAIKEYVTRHAKTQTVAISEQLNEHIWQNGMKNPITKVQVIVKKEAENAHVRMLGEDAPVEKKAEEAPKEGIQAKVDELKNKVTGAKKKVEPVKKKKVEDKKPVAKPTETEKPKTEEKVEAKADEPKTENKKE